MSLLSLTALEIVLGLDNVIFISILAGDLPKEQQPQARKLGLGFALLTRLGLLFAISWFMGLTKPMTTIMGLDITGKSLILFAGGMFLIGKSAWEIYEKMEVDLNHGGRKKKVSSLAIMISQIALIDIVFSLDSVITAVGMADHIIIMVIAMIIAMMVMLIFAGPVSDFVNRHPSVKILALAFLLLIGVLLLAESLNQHVSKGTIYFAMGFSLFIEMMNMKIRKRSAAKIMSPESS